MGSGLTDVQLHNTDSFESTDTGRAVSVCTLRTSQYLSLAASLYSCQSVNLWSTLSRDTSDVRHRFKHFSTVTPAQVHVEQKFQTLKKKGHHLFG